MPEARGLTINHLGGDSFKGVSEKIDFSKKFKKKCSEGVQEKKHLDGHRKKFVSGNLHHAPQMINGRPLIMYARPTVHCCVAYDNTFPITRHHHDPQ